MLEAAYDYLEASRSVRAGRPRLILSALSLEIILKSFNSKPSENFNKIDERYEFSAPTVNGGKPGGRKPHDLYELFKTVPNAFHPLILRRASDIEVIVLQKDAFAKARYFYEKTEYINGTNQYNRHVNRLQEIATYSLCMLTLLYKFQGCGDLFINFTEAVTDFEKSEASRWYIVRDPDEP